MLKTLMNEILKNKRHPELVSGPQGRGINTPHHSLSRKVRGENGFTLAEVLITLGIIGVVAAMTIPTLMHNSQEHQFKVAYKKAYSDISNAFSKAMIDETLTPRISIYDATATESEWEVMQSAFKNVKTCDLGEINNCWMSGGESLSTGENEMPDSRCKGFIDSSGRSWAEYSNAENIYLVDTNGFKKPNQFGQDRWMFFLCNSSNLRTQSGLSSAVCPEPDLTYKTWNCHYPPCYSTSWLIGK